MAASRSRVARSLSAGTTWRMLGRPGQPRQVPANTRHLGGRRAHAEVGPSEQQDGGEHERAHGSSPELDFGRAVMRDVATRLTYTRPSVYVVWRGYRCDPDQLCTRSRTRLVSYNRSGGRHARTRPTGVVGLNYLKA